jgi:hypothetical protein
MRLRSSALVLATMSVAMAFLGHASAAVAAVGGGASTFEASVLSSGLLSPGVGTISDPPGSVVILPSPNGSATPLTKQVAGQKIGPVSFQTGYVSTRGTLDGMPYAQSSASVAGVFVPGSLIQAVATECVWDVTGAKGSTTVVDTLGRSFMPRPNTRINIPGGYIVLNEQVRSTTPDGAEVITVKGAHVVLVQSLVLGLPSTVTFDAALAYSSCDPRLPPSLTGLLLVD